MFAGTPVRGAVHTATWLGGEAPWGQAARWSGQVVPRNTDADQFDVVIDGNGAGSSFVIVGDSPYDVMTLNSLTVDSGDEMKVDEWASGPVRLTVLDSLRVNGGVYLNAATLTIGSNGTLVGAGTIACTGGKSYLTSLSGSLAIPQGMRLRATGDFYSPQLTIGQTSDPLVNNGVVSAASPYTTVTLRGSSFTNSGTLEVVNGARLEINTTIQQWSDLGTIVNGGFGLVRLLGTLENTGRTFHIDGSFPLELGGTVRGGTITSSNDARFVTPAGTTRLDGVTVNAPITVQERLRVASGQPLAGAGDVLLINPASSIGTEGGTFTIPSTFTVHGQGTVGSSAAPLVNRALVRADLPGTMLAVVGSGIVNEGTLEVSSSSTLLIAGSVRTADLGTVTNNGGTLVLAGTIDNAGETFRNTAATKWQLSGGRIVGGVVETDAGQELRIAYASSGTLDGVTLNGVVRFPSTNLASLYIPNGLRGTGTVMLNGVTPTISTSPSSSSEPLFIGEGITLTGGSAQIGKSGQAVGIHGTIEPKGRITISGSSVLADGVMRIASRSSIHSDDLSFGDGGRLAMDVAPTQIRAFLEVAGDLDLRGEDFLELSPVSLQNGRIAIVSYSGTLLGEFDHVTPGWVVDYSSPHAIYVSIPEPTGVAMISAAAPLLGLCCLHKRARGARAADLRPRSPLHRAPWCSSRK